MKTVLVLLAFVSLSVGCRPAVIPDPMIPHRVAADDSFLPLAPKDTIVIWVKRPDGSFSKQRVKLSEGWWIASPSLIGE
jgi:hypothetical protein